MPARRHIEVLIATVGLWQWHAHIMIVCCPEGAIRPIRYRTTPSIAPERSAEALAVRRRHLVPVDRWMPTSCIRFNRCSRATLQLGFAAVSPDARACKSQSIRATRLAVERYKDPSAKHSRDSTIRRPSHLYSFLLRPSAYLSLYSPCSPASPSLLPSPPPPSWLARRS